MVDLKRSNRAWRRGLATSSAITILLGLVALDVGVSPSTAAAQESAPTITTEVVESFDGTPLVATLLVPPGVTASSPAPLVLRTHGWGGRGEQTPQGFIGKLLDAGYIVLTWDQRGFGCSGGEVNLDRPEVEGQDVKLLIDWAISKVPVESDTTGDPIIGMSGGSYAGAIQPAAAAVDDRIDAIAPEASWSDLRYSLYGGSVANQGWIVMFYAAGLVSAGGLGLDPSCATFPQVGGLHPTLSQGFIEVVATGAVSAPVLDYFAASSVAAYGDRLPLRVPTLVIQGSTDTLFDLRDGYGIVEQARSAGAPTRFVVYCGGHIACPISYGDADDLEHIESAVLTWFDRYLRGDMSVDVGPPVEYRTNEGIWRAATEFPTVDTATASLRGSGHGSLINIPAVEVPDLEPLVDQITINPGRLPDLPITSAQVSPAGDPRAMTIELGGGADSPIELLGIPSVQLTVTGDGTEVILLAKLVDRESDHVVNLQEGAIRVPLQGTDSSVVEVPMPGIAYTLPAGHHLDLQVSTSSLMHATSRTPSAVEVTANAAVPVGAAHSAAPLPPAGDLVGDGPTRTPSEGPPAGEPPAPVGAQLPSTGGSPGLLVPAVAMLVALLMWRAKRAASDRREVRR